MKLSLLCVPLCILFYYFGLYLLLKDPKIYITLPDKTEISIESKVQRDHHFEKSPHPTLTK